VNNKNPLFTSLGLSKRSFWTAPTKEKLMQTPFTVNNKPFFILGGQVHNSSGYTKETLETAYQAIKLLKANMIEIPVYWERIEPSEGKFDFSELDLVIMTARAAQVRLVLLWFATWKNGSMQYAPEWVKADPQRFWQVTTHAGNSLWVLSSHCPATLEADRKAFCTLLEHLKTVNEDQTIIGIQIENEPGILGAVRDYGPAAEAEFAGAVPTDLLSKLPLSKPGPVHTAWEGMGCPSSGAWAEVFGEKAPEFFTAWSIARYTDRLAEAGKAVYNLPMYVNVWLGENGWHLPGGSYPSGGPASQALDIWKWATAHIDLIAPDIYIEPEDAYNAICQSYAREDNPLFIPESGSGLSNALNLFVAIARHHTVGYAVFGIESLLAADGSVRPECRPLVESFQCAAAALPLIEKFHGTGLIHAVAQREFQGEQLFDFGDYLGMAQFGKLESWPFYDFRHRPDGAPQRGRGLIFTPNAREFFLVGAGYRLLLRKKLSDRQEFSRPHDRFDAPLTHYLRVEEGHFDAEGNWHIDRYRNGDEITGGLWVAPDVGVVHAILAD
jgi:hypothetical protein